MRSWVLIALCWISAVHAQVPAIRPATQAIQAPSRLIDVIDIDEHESQVDITLQFNCPLHYAGHTPAREGPELRLQLRPDRNCGTSGPSLATSDTPTEIPHISGPQGIISAARLESSLAGEVTIT